VTEDTFSLPFETTPKSQAIVQDLRKQEDAIFSILANLKLSAQSDLPKILACEYARQALQAFHVANGAGEADLEWMREIVEANLGYLQAAPMKETLANWRINQWGEEEGPSRKRRR